MADRNGLRGTCEGAMMGLIVEERLRKGLANEREETEVEIDRLERVVKMGEGFLGPRLGLPSIRAATSRAPIFPYPKLGLR